MNEKTPTNPAMSEPDPDTSQLMDRLLKAMTDENRLKIIGLLAVKPHSKQEIARALGMDEAKVSHNLQILESMRLVKEGEQGYAFASETIYSLSRQAQSRPQPKSVYDDFEGDEDDLKVLRSYVHPEGRIKALPTQQKKLLVVLHYAAQRTLQPGMRYTEKQVNDLLRKYYDDYAMLRRYLVDNQIMERESSGGQYWLREEKPA